MNQSLGNFVAIQIARLLQGSGCRTVGLDLSQAMLTVVAESATRALLLFDTDSGIARIIHYGLIYVVCGVPIP
jgi:hypothetical protein